MYKIDEIREVHLEVTSKCQASCPMCARNIQGGLVNPWLIENEITLEKFISWFPKSFISQLDRLFMCGNLGDAIVAKDTLEIFDYIRKNNPNISLALHTNGSARNKNWWARLSGLNVEVTFGIDGLEDTHHLYRIGTDFNKIIENARAFIEAGGKARWHMLVFDHNKHQIEQCRKLSEEYGFSNFTVKNSARFQESFLQVLTKSGTTSHIIYPSDRSKNISKKLENINVNNTTISCKSEKNKSLYIGADGSVTPCCWLDFTGIIPINKNKIDYIDKGFITPNLNFQSLENIFCSDYFSSIKETWKNNPLKQCNKQCGEIDKLNEQFIQ